MGLWLVARRPVFSKVGYSNSPDLNSNVRVPALSMARPRSLRGTLLTNSFVSVAIPPAVFLRL